MKTGDLVTGKVASIAPFGCFVEVGGGFTGLLHASEIALPEGSASWEEAIKEGDELQVGTGQEGAAVVRDDLVGCCWVAAAGADGRAGSRSGG